MSPFQPSASTIGTLHRQLLYRDQRLRHSSRSAIMANAQDEVHGKKSPRIMVSEVVDEPDKKLDAGASAFVTRPASMQHHHHPHQEQQQTTFATTPPSSSPSFFSPPSLLSPNNNNNNTEYDHSSSTSSTTRRYPIEDPASLPPLPPQALASHSTFSPDTEDADDKDESNMHLRSIRPLHNDSVPGFTPLDSGASSPFIKAIRKAQKKRRGSVGEGTLRRQKAISAPVEPRLTKSSTHAQQRRHRPISNITTTSSPLRTHQEEEDNNDHWDPHIDAFEVLRAKITGITRTMQEFHVQELFYDELTERNNNRQRHHTIATTTTYQRRMSTSAESPCDPTPNHLLMDKSQSLTNRHRRIRSHGSAADFDSTTNAINSPPPPPPAPTADETRYHENNDPWSHLRTDEDFEHDLRHKSTATFSDDDELDMINNRDNDYDDDDDDITISPPMAPTSPNLTALFLTTNSLINSRLDELSETASIASSCGGGDDINQSSSNEWRLQFLDLVSACITQSEELESLSTELLGTERRVRELLVINGTVNEQYHEREKAYEERIRECEEVAKQQLIMIDTLEELMADIDMKLTHHLDHNDYEHDADSGIEDDTDRSVEEDEERWDFKRAVADILGVETQGDLVHKMRWEVGMFVGGGVGTGHVIHSFEGQLRGIEMMIAGSGTTVEDSPIRISQQDQIDETTHISPSLPRNKFHHHHYMLHISARDRKTRFRMIPQAHWVPDQMASHCQFTSTRPCSVKFSLFQRRHHCRKCGIVVCQRHSGNRLPLFAKSSAPPQWSRVCDKCFCNLIMTGDE
ncbi:hypothetical protein RO3G_04347 [Lichtheimia corymbifera JMRC:FSU:9682]|uniref:FYVE-type domain-containing protein n=1 Tax=Lichtheimia corymbifera JMRC:FSU:9682 TaxID=1263082 RepID=A0A068RSR4_9FUNG|nr:hypothetical protein RO3G_04347 [Lichtheimia corymbifera JMRC:FSU:9682]